MQQGGRAAPCCWGFVSLLPTRLLFWDLSTSPSSLLPKPCTAKPLQMSNPNALRHRLNLPFFVYYFVYGKQFNRKTGQAVVSGQVHRAAPRLALISIIFFSLSPYFFLACSSPSLLIPFSAPVTSQTNHSPQTHFSPEIPVLLHAYPNSIFLLSSPVIPCPCRRYGYLAIATLQDLLCDGSLRLPCGPQRSLSTPLSHTCSFICSQTLSSFSPLCVLR